MAIPSEEVYALDLTAWPSPRSRKTVLQGGAAAEMRKLETIVWRIRAGDRRLSLSNVPPLWNAGTPLGSWLNQIDLWSPGLADPRVVTICGLVQHNAGDCEHRVLDVNDDTITLCSRIDPAAARDRLAFL